MAKRLDIMFLGGLGEIGKNMTALEYNNNIIIIDAGMAFPNTEEMPGIDYIIPDFNYLIQNKDKVKGIVLTHGHEDHIGAMPYVLREINAPVYGSNIAMALLGHKLNEHKIKNATLNEIKDREVVNIGCFNVEFIRVCHSIAGAFALSINTPRGIVFFTGDFKIDHTPIDGRPADLTRIAQIGAKGITLLLSDSTNVERDGYSMSEQSVGKSLDVLFSNNMNKRLIVATFASNIHRVQQIINCALKYGRRIAFSGRSMQNIAKIAHKIKELNYPMDAIVDIDKIDKVPYDKLCIISTGTQGEPESALTRMSLNEFRKIVIGDTDTVIFSASPIPGNEKMIYNVINNLYRMGAEVIYKDLSEVHVSGHACKEELKLMMALLKPKFFIPVHGEYRHLKQHAELAVSMGINRANILIPEVGNVVEISRGGLKKRDNIQSGSIMLDGSLMENSELLLRDRRHLAEDGFVVAIVNITKSGNLFGSPIIITRGINLSENIIEDMKEVIRQRFKGQEAGEMDGNDVRSIIRKATAKILFNRLRRRPMVIPITIEV